MSRYRHDTDARSHQRTRPSRYTDRHPSDPRGNAKALLIGVLIGLFIVLGFLTRAWPA